MKQFLHEVRSGWIVGFEVLVAFWVGLTLPIQTPVVAIALLILVVAIALVGSAAYGALNDLKETYRRWWEMK